MIVLILIHSDFRTWNIPPASVEWLRREFPAHVFVHARNDEEGLAAIPRAEAAFSSQVNPDQLRAARILRWIHSPAAGVGGMLYPEMQESPVVVTNSRGLSSDTIAEHVLAVTLALFRRLPLAVRRQDAHVWAQDEINAPPAGRTIAGAHVLIVGLGAIGRATAARMHALGATVSAVRRRPGPAPAGIADVYGSGDLLPAVAGADLVVIAAPQTPQTRGMFGDRELRGMKRGAVLVNVSRGGLVDEAALAAALRDGRLGGAALDVFRHEPLDPADALWDAPNLLVTPHTAGYRRDHWEAASALFAENLRRFERGDPLLNVVDKQAGY